MSISAVDIKLSAWSGDQVGRAVTSLLNYIGKQKDSANELFDDDETIFMLISLKKMPMSSRKDMPVALKIPHPLVDVSGAEVCLFVKDHDGTGHKEIKKRVDKLEKRGGVNKVIGIHKLRTKYESFEAKRQLCKMYDIFLADERVMPSLPKLIGKTFFKKKKQPIPINLKSKDLAAQIRNACASTYLFKNSGTCMNIKVGTSSFEAKQLEQNLHAALASAADHIPRKWHNIQAVYIKTAESVALPLWQCLPETISRIDPSAGAAKAKKPVAEAKPHAAASAEKAAPKPAGTQRPKVAKGKSMQKSGAKKGGAKEVGVKDAGVQKVAGKNMLAGAKKVEVKKAVTKEADVKVVVKEAVAKKAEIKAVAKKAEVKAVAKEVVAKDAVAKKAAAKKADVKAVTKEVVAKKVVVQKAGMKKKVKVAK